MMRTAVFSVVLFMTVSTSIYSDTINIPADYPTIQEGIDAAVNGDTVLVAPGTYVEIIDFLGKAITVMGDQGPENTVIDGNQAGSVVAFQNGEGLNSVLEGFTISNGYVPNSDGGGINCQQASPTIKNNIITGNCADTWGNGGGICCYDASPTIINNTISGNDVYGWYSDGQGGGIFCYNSSAKIINNTITGNSTYCPSGGGRGGGICWKGIGGITISYNTITGNSSAQGGGIHCESNDVTISHNTISGNYGGLGGGICCLCLDSLSTITNNTITGNEADEGGGIYCYESSPTVTNNIIFDNLSYSSGGGIMCHCTSSPIITNTIIWNNDAPTGKEICVGSTYFPSTLTINYSDVEGGQSSCYVDPGCTLSWGAGMIDSDPLFMDPLNNDFHLTFNSPCRGSGDNSAVTELYDFEGDPRIAWGGTVDMGADEFYTHLYITGDQTPGGNIQGKFVGLPSTSPVRLFLGLGGVRPTPFPTAYGDLWLLPPRLSIPLVPIPANGILAIPATLPMSPPAPYDIPMQGLVGLNSDSLTNLCVLEVR